VTATRRTAIAVYYIIIYTATDPTRPEDSTTLRTTSLILPPRQRGLPIRASGLNSSLLDVINTERQFSSIMHRSACRNFHRACSYIYIMYMKNNNIYTKNLQTTTHPWDHLIAHPRSHTHISSYVRTFLPKSINSYIHIRSLQTDRPPPFRFFCKTYILPM